jgi:hypothetical protein
LALAILVPQTALALVRLVSGWLLLQEALKLVEQKEKGKEAES